MSPRTLDDGHLSRCDLEMGSSNNLLVLLRNMSRRLDLAIRGMERIHADTHEPGGNDPLTLVPNHDHSGDAGDGGAIAAASHTHTTVPDHDHTGDAGDGGALTIAPSVKVAFTTSAGETTVTGDTNWHNEGSAASITTTVTCTLIVQLSASIKTSSASYHCNVDVWDGVAELILLGTVQTGYVGQTKSYIATGKAAGTYSFQIRQTIENATATGYMSGATLLVTAVPE